MSRLRRFHGVTDGVSHADQVLSGAAGADAFAAWSDTRCIGLASLAVAEDGSALAAALVDRAKERRVPTLVADVLTDNRFIVRLLARIGPTTTSFVYGGYRACVELEP